MGRMLPVTQRTQLHRFAARGSHEFETVCAILDAAPMAHLGFEHNGAPAVLPMAFWRRDDFVYFHGSAQNRLFAALAGGSACCFAATLLDAFVPARAALHHSVNYRSVVIYGRAEEVTGDDDKREALQGLIERFYPGRWSKIRQPSDGELAMARVFRLPIAEASAKVRSGFPTPYRQDRAIPVWAGVAPVHTRLGTPAADGHVPPDIAPEDFSHLDRLLQGAS